MTTEIRTRSFLHTGVERRASQRGMTTSWTPVDGPAARTQNDASGRAPVLLAGVPSVAAGQLGEWRSMLTRPQLRLIAATTIRSLFLITVATLLIFVLLPAMLSAQWASFG
jgi:hypothetical protein